MLQPSPNRAGLSKDEELQLSWQVLFTVTKNPGTTNIIPYKIQVYQWQYMYNNTFHNKNHLTSSSYCVQMPWHQLSQQLGRRHLLTNHHISFKFLYMTKHQGTGRLAWNRHFKANLPWEKLERNHKSITHNLCKIPSLSQALACRRVGNKPLPNPVNGYRTNDVADT